MTQPTLDPAVDYPLSVNRKDLLFTPTGKSIDDITHRSRRFRRGSGR